ncbi:MAG TPA: ABC-type transport auxiliary lipoprotein family protein [Syntrophales bacterium]|nr:ABC-type transport auxiliary lipoprotein family protein [Syntrophales bacterium]HOM07894.1 ABC-type transport auxiliary lipoprotein family protein [Syntrophales bacterium]HOO00289.1 ABC-type transport auxiliary lipoprotein family protein [Syntrophales bacterium]HPC01788.1 ABC-type transport auxiliary lipoprotein family protein [Syntrophales bacterium]HPQ07385.1 ABC-type transport auxiliary lipoprotein family protein [Syntrophales bacterium]
MKNHLALVEKTVGFATTLLAVFLFTACFGIGRSVVNIVHYALEYPPPPAAGTAPASSAIRVERFSANAEVALTEMSRRVRPYVRDVYPRARWRAAPADMITALIVRDLREAGIYQAVLGPEEGGEARFDIEGRVEEFIRDGVGAEKPTASLVVAVIIWDQGAEGERRVALQKTYRLRETLAADDPAEFARAMSKAVEAFSRDLLRDLAAMKRTP